MGGVFTYPAIPAIGPVPTGKTRIYVAGWPMSPHVGRAEALARSIATFQPSKYETWFFFSFGEALRGPNGDGKGGLYAQAKATFPAEDQERLAAHKSVPFVWIQTSDGMVKGLGGRDRFCEWVGSQPELIADEKIKSLSSSEPGLSDIFPDTSPGTSQPAGLTEKSC